MEKGPGKRMKFQSPDMGGKEKTSPGFVGVPRVREGQRRLHKDPLDEAKGGKKMGEKALGKKTRRRLVITIAKNGTDILPAPRNSEY